MSSIPTTICTYCFLLLLIFPFFENYLIYNLYLLLSLLLIFLFFENYWTDYLITHQHFFSFIFWLLNQFLYNWRTHKFITTMRSLEMSAWCTGEKNKTISEVSKVNLEICLSVTAAWTEYAIFGTSFCSSICFRYRIMEQKKTIILQMQLPPL